MIGDRIHALQEDVRRLELRRHPARRLPPYYDPDDKRYSPGLSGQDAGGPFDDAGFPQEVDSPSENEIEWTLPITLQTTLSLTGDALLPTEVDGEFQVQADGILLMTLSLGLTPIGESHWPGGPGPDGDPLYGITQQAYPIAMAYELCARSADETTEDALVVEALTYVIGPTGTYVYYGDPSPDPIESPIEGPVWPLVTNRALTVLRPFKAGTIIFAKGWTTAGVRIQFDEDFDAVAYAADPDHYRRLASWIPAVPPYLCHLSYNTAPAVRTSPWLEVQRLSDLPAGVSYTDAFG